MDEIPTIGVTERTVAAKPISQIQKAENTGAKTRPSRVGKSGGSATGIARSHVLIIHSDEGF